MTGGFSLLAATGNPIVWALLLLAFCVTTYAFAPVAGFGWLIATMGLAQCRPHQQTLRGAYLAVFILILLYSEFPWTGVLAEWAVH